ncbi:hypothetical protein [Aureivirga sp. CE67]|uniref:hypothetical protein n=1 Tax=Aureivirga sp. CE67 TaxID=1788983 RepID=UPI0018CB4988|nr:hypothetical protein [Aureivirga sp. CE67]
MKLNKILLFSLIFSSASMISCKNESKIETKPSKKIKIEKVYNSEIIPNYDTIAYKSFRSTNPDSLYTSVFKDDFSEEDKNQFINSWTNFIKSIGDYKSKEEHTWETQDSLVKVTSKVYFKKNGEVDYFTYKIRNKNISDKDKKYLEETLSDFVKHEKLDYANASKFSQCGSLSFRTK